MLNYCNSSKAISTAVIEANKHLPEMYTLPKIKFGIFFRFLNIIASFDENFYIYLFTDAVLRIHYILYQSLLIIITFYKQIYVHTITITIALW